MSIQLHSFISSAKRYIQVESQPHQIVGIFKKITCAKSYRSFVLESANTCYECEEDATITFYQAGSSVSPPGIWTYLVYECPDGEEKVFSDESIDTSTNPLWELASGKTLSKVAVDLLEYIQYQQGNAEYLDVQLPSEWDTSTGREIIQLLIEEINAGESASIFAEEAGKEYIQAALQEFVAAAQEILEAGGTSRDFEATQYYVLKKVKSDRIANLILEYNDYRIWQEALPSKSKAVEYAFNKALSLICRLK
ncbi:MAG: hypothetical protein H0X31_05735 [Nostocaceae cyanobacterium]|nr:hypothetical protein [Nostocaceae cyanobacterium]